jgi:uncharacterized protein YdeI (YjbR/CyaY-like superfamily)
MPPPGKAFVLCGQTYLTADPTAHMEGPRFFEDSTAFRTWLCANANTATELLVGYHKIGTGRPSMSWSESVDEALCFGWIDGVRKRIDEFTYSIRFTPRKPSSIWSAVNIAKHEKLVDQGRMTSAGAFAFAQRSPTRSAVYAYEQARTAELTDEELGTFKQMPSAWRFFNACPPSYKKVVLHWVTTAKRSETRSARLAKLVQACSVGLRLR